MTAGGPTPDEQPPMTAMDDPVGSGPISPRRSRRWRWGAAAAAVVVLLGAGGWWVWREDHTFCHEVAALPDLTGSIDRTGSPASGLASYADQLDRVADEAPDAQTAEAARALAAAQRSVAGALDGTTVGTGVPAAVTGAADPAQVSALQQLQQAITQHCPSR
jgi:hypothetical protein